jgi:hypothetical protein
MMLLNIEPQNYTEFGGEKERREKGEGRRGRRGEREKGGSTGGK